MKQLQYSEHLSHNLFVFSFQFLKFVYNNSVSNYEKEISNKLVSKLMHLLEELAYIFLTSIERLPVKYRALNDNLFSFSGPVCVKTKY